MTTHLDDRGPSYRGLRLHGPIAEFHQAVHGLRWDTVPAALDHPLPNPSTLPRHRRHDPSEGQAQLLEEAS